jgi:hypothetical protein
VASAVGHIVQAVVRAQLPVDTEEQRDPSGAASFVLSRQIEGVPKPSGPVRRRRSRVHGGLGVTRQDAPERGIAEARVLAAVQDQFPPEIVHQNRRHGKLRRRVSDDEPEPLPGGGLHECKMIAGQLGMLECEPLTHASGKLEDVLRFDPLINAELSEHPSHVLIVQVPVSGVKASDASWRVLTVAYIQS